LLQGVDGNVHANSRFIVAKMGYDHTHAQYIHKYATKTDAILGYKINPRDFDARAPYSMKKSMLTVKLDNGMWSGRFNTTQDNTLRMWTIWMKLAVYYGYIQDYWVCCSGDDTIHVIERRSLDKFRKACSEAFSTNLDISKPEVKGVGLQLKELIEGGKNGAFLSKDFEFHRGSTLFTRFANRIVTTGCYTLNVDGIDLTEAVYNDVITNQLLSQIKDDSDPLRRVVEQRIKLLTHNKSTKADEIKVVKHTDALWNAKYHEGVKQNTAFTTNRLMRLAHVASTDEVLEAFHAAA